MNTRSRLGGLLGGLGGLVWAAFFLMEALGPGWRGNGQLGFMGILIISIVLQAAGFYSLSLACKQWSSLRLTALVAAGAASVQAGALFVSSSLGFGAAWLFGIIAEMVISVALLAFAFASLATKVPLLVRYLPFLMVPLYYVGWAIDPQGKSVAGVNVINLSAAIYGLLWMPFGYAIWRALRDQHRNGRPA